MDSKGTQPYMYYIHSSLDYTFNSGLHHLLAFQLLFLPLKVILCTATHVNSKILDLVTAPFCTLLSVTTSTRGGLSVLA